MNAGTSLNPGNSTVRLSLLISLSFYFPLFPFLIPYFLPTTSQISGQFLNPHPFFLPTSEIALPETEILSCYWQQMLFLLRIRGLFSFASFPLLSAKVFFCSAWHPILSLFSLQKCSSLPFSLIWTSLLLLLTSCFSPGLPQFLSFSAFSSLSFTFLAPLCLQVPAAAVQTSTCCSASKRAHNAHGCGADKQLPGRKGLLLPTQPIFASLSGTEAIANSCR